ncbi:hypothetical protein E8E14_003545 [Neopestalotiopsis sp. 37M]|nr:hypothetical protein E8E14_003545 [Neopestalotiopsis sp. 37M]
MEKNAKKVVEAIWSFPSEEDHFFNGQPFKRLTCRSYYAYYKKHCSIMFALSGSPAATPSHPTVIDIIQSLQSGLDRHAALVSLQRQTGLTDEVCENLLDLAARLLLMVKFGTIPTEGDPRGHLDWTSGSLEDFTKSYFKTLPKLSCETIRLPKQLNAWSIASVAGIDIVLTENLAEHLLLIDDDRKLLVFHHASFLELQRSSIFPDGFVEETLRTLALLFPEAEFRKKGGWITESSKQKWFRTLYQKPPNNWFVPDERLGFCGTLPAANRHIDCFKFWRDRLVILKQAYDEATPRTLSQWWHDERDSVRWSTFWVAILVLIITTFLGIIQCVEGALQVYKSFT